MASTPPADPNAGTSSGPVGDTRTWYWVAVLSFITLGIYFLWWTYKTFEELKQHSNQGVGGVVGLIIGIFVGIVNAFLIPSEVKNAYERDGKTPPITPVWGFWWFLPLVGFIIWIWKTQESLNDYWASKG